MSGQRIQQLVFGLFILLFFVSAPLVVLYTAGYRWNPQGGVVRTGTVFVASTPRNATITLDGTPYRDKAPTVIKTLKPASYTIGLSLPKHLSWEKNLDVREGETTFIENVLLFLDASPQLVLREDMHSAAWSPAGTHVAWASHEAGWTEVWITGIERPSSRLVYRTQLDEDLTLTWLDGNRVRMEQEDGNQIVDRDGELTTDTSTSDRIALEPDGDAVDVRVDSETLARLPFGTYEVIDERGPYILLRETTRDQIALLTTADADEPLLLQEDAEFVDWIREDALAFATPFSMSIYEPSKHQTTLITRISDRIHNVAWHPDGGYIFYATDTEARVIELDDRDGRRETVLATMPEIDTIFPHPRGRALYIVGNNGIDTGLFERELYER